MVGSFDFKDVKIKEKRAFKMVHLHKNGTPP